MAMIGNVIGTIGVILCLVGYFLLQCGKVSSTDLSFSLYNLFGAAGILFSLIYEWNLPAFLIEGAWVLISILGVVRYLMRRRVE
jgi:hypothetical protein